MANVNPFAVLDVDSSRETTSSPPPPLLPNTPEVLELIQAPEGKKRSFADVATAASSGTFTFTAPPGSSVVATPLPVEKKDKPKKKSPPKKQQPKKASVTPDKRPAEKPKRERKNKKKVVDDPPTNPPSTPVVPEEKKTVDPPKKPQGTKRDLKLVEPFIPGSTPSPYQISVFKNVLRKIQSNYLPFVDEEDHEWFKAIFGKLPQTANPGVKGINPHGRLAVLRTMANMFQYTNVLLVDPDKSLRYGSVDFVYGTESRDKALVDYVNKELGFAGFGTEENPCFIAHFVGSPLTPDDMRRRVNGVGARSKIGILMDVYALGNLRLHPVNIASFGYEIWTWCGHVFNGPFGGYETAIWCREGIDFSNVWYKADKTCQPYEVHDACDIMHKSGRASFEDTSVVWGVADRVNTRFKGSFIPVYTITVGQKTDKLFIDNSLRTLDPIDTVFLELKDPIIKSRFDYVNNVVAPWLASVGVYKKRKIPMAVSMYADLKDKCTARFYNQWTFGSVLTDVNNYFNDQLWFKELEKNLPDHFVNYRFDAATAIYSELCEKKKDCLLMMNHVHGTSMAVANDSFKSIGQHVTPDPWVNTRNVMLACAGVGLAGLAFASWKGYIKPSPAVSGVVRSILDKPAVVGFNLPEPPKESGLPLVAKTIKDWFKGVFNPIRIPFLSDFVYDNVGRRICSLDAGWKRAFVGVMYCAVLGPVIEESVKHVFPLVPVKWVIALLMANLDHGLATTNMDFTCSFLKHFVLSLLPLDSAIVLHILHNSYVVCKAYQELATQPMCVGSSPCLKAIFSRKSCDGRVMASNNNCTSLTEYRLLMEVQPMVVLQTDLLPFNPSTESFVKSSNCLPKYPGALDSTVSMSCNVDIAAFSQDSNIPDYAQGYYNIFAVSCPQYRPACTGYNTFMMVVNRLCKAPPAYEVLNKVCPITKLGLADPKYVYYENVYLQKLFSHLSTSLPRNEAVRYSRKRKADHHVYNFYGKAHEVPMPHVLVEHAQSDEGFFKWLKHLSGAKKTFYFKMRETFKVRELNVTSRCVAKCDNSIKNDETLLKRLFVPRPVHRVDPEFASFIGPYVYEASVLMKERYYFYPFYVSGADVDKTQYVVTLTFGSSMNSLDLTTWFDQAIHPSWYINKCADLLLKKLDVFYHVLVAGDDVLIVKTWISKNLVEIIEADVSSCDHSTRLSMLEFEWAMLGLFGVPLNVLSLLRHNACSALKIVHPKNHREVIRVTRGHERNTGGVDTTVGNSTCVGHVWVSTLLENIDKSMSMEDYQIFLFNKFGLEMKLQCHEMTGDCTISDTGTFLKGMWYHGSHPSYKEYYFWGPLTSRLIKLSKVMTKPLAICRQNSKKCFPRHNGQATIQELWFCMMQMIKAMSAYVFVPPVRAWFLKLITKYDTQIAVEYKLPLYNDVAGRTDDSSELHKVVGSHTACEVELCPCWVERLAKRYNCSVEMVLDWSTHIQDIEPGMFSIHPFWSVLGQVDYN